MSEPRATGGAFGKAPADPFADPIALALVEVVAERGYEGTDVDAVVERARVTRAEFNRRFVDKEDCVLKVYEAFIEDFVTVVQNAYASQAEWRSALRAAAYAAADWLTEHPATARFGGVDVLYARNEMIRVRREQVFQYCAGLIDAGRKAVSDPDSVPEAAATMSIGAIAQMLTQGMQRGQDLEAWRMVPQLMYRTVRPYVGEKVAREELTMPRPQVGTD